MFPRVNDCMWGGGSCVCKWLVFCPSPLCSQNFASFNLCMMHGQDYISFIWLFKPPPRFCDFLLPPRFVLMGAHTGCLCREREREGGGETERMGLVESSSFLSNILKPLQSLRTRNRQSWSAAIAAENQNAPIRISLPASCAFSPAPTSYLGGVSECPLELSPASNVWTAIFTQSPGQI